jgi:hypothetical protein
MPSNHLGAPPSIRYQRGVATLMQRARRRTHDSEQALDRSPPNRGLSEYPVRWLDHDSQELETWRLSQPQAGTTRVNPLA